VDTDRLDNCAPNEVGSIGDENLKDVLRSNETLSSPSKGDTETVAGFAGATVGALVVGDAVDDVDVDVGAVDAPVVVGVVVGVVVAEVVDKV
jgi:hypothetical protein